MEEHWQAELAVEGLGIGELALGALEARGDGYPISCLTRPHGGIPGPSAGDG
jgi:hypothetical protein